MIPLTRKFCANPSVPSVLKMANSSSWSCQARVVGFITCWDNSTDVFSPSSCPRAGVDNTIVTTKALKPIALRCVTLIIGCFLPGRPMLQFKRVDNTSVVRHVDHGPAFLHGFIESLVERSDWRLPVVRPFPYGVGVVDVKLKTFHGFGVRPPQQRQVSVRISAGNNGFAANIPVYAHGLPFLVVEEVKLGEPHKPWIAIIVLVFCFDAAAH